MEIKLLITTNCGRLCLINYLPKDGFPSGNQMPSRGARPVFRGEIIMRERTKRTAPRCYDRYLKKSQRYETVGQARARIR